MKIALLICLNLLLLPYSFANTDAKAKSDLDKMAEALKLVGENKDSEAQALFQEVIQSKSNLTEYAYFESAKLYQKAEDYKSAKWNYQKILELSPNIKMQNQVRKQLTEMSLQEKKFKEAKNWILPLEKKSRREENYPEVIYELARAEKGLNNYGPFCKWVRKLYAKYPDYENVKDWGPFLKENLIDGKPTGCANTVEDQKNRIRNMQWAGLSDKAKQEIEAMKTRYPAEETSRFELQYLLHEGEAQKALDMLIPSYKDKKGNFNYLIVLGSAAARAGEMQMAVGSYYAAAKLSPKSKLGRQALYQSAFLSYQIQDYDGAARRFKEFIKRYPTSGLSRDAKWHLAWLRYLKGDFAGAYKSFSDLQVAKNRKSRSKISNDRVIYWMAMSEFRSGRFDKAKTLFESLTKDRLMGFYSLSAQSRLKKIDSLLPKLAKYKSVLEANSRRLTRFSMSEVMLPSDEMTVADLPSTEESESEENIELTTIKGQDELLTNPENGETAEPDEAMVSENTGQDGNSKEEEPAPEEEKVTSFANPVLVKKFERARDLMILGLNDWAKWELYDIERKTSNKDYLKALMTEYENVQNYHRSAYIGQVYFGSQRAQHGIEGVKYLWEHAYPRAYQDQVERYSRLFSIPTELIWGIMRAESQYKRDVISPVGALGLMQVMPGTGQKVAERIKDKNFYARKLLEPETAIKLGSAYLQLLMRKFDNNIALVAGGYNAGSHRVKNWISAFGNLEMDEFIEHVPFVETRNYIKKVVSNFIIYEQLYQPKKDAQVAFLSESIGVRFDKFFSREAWEEL